jgi:hypothetical protein
MLYALQTASANMRSAKFEARDVTDVVIDPHDVHRTCIGGQQWFEEDFDDPEEAEGEEEDGNGEETEAEAEGEDAVVAAPAHAAPAPKKTPEAKTPTTEQARKNVQALVRNWLLETVSEQSAGKPT